MNVITSPSQTKQEIMKMIKHAKTHIDYTILKQRERFETMRYIAHNSFSDKETE